MRDAGRAVAGQGFAAPSNCFAGSLASARVSVFVSENIGVFVRFPDLQAAIPRRSDL